MAAIRRLQKEKAEIDKFLEERGAPDYDVHPLDDVHPVTSGNFTAEPLPGDDFRWTCTMWGSHDSPYTDINDIVTFELKFPIDYPFRRPEVLFTSKFKHPRVDYETGNLALKIEWSPKTKLIDLFEIIYGILFDHHGCDEKILKSGLGVPPLRAFNCFFKNKDSSFAECIPSRTPHESLNSQFLIGPQVTHMGLYPCQTCWDRHTKEQNDLFRAKSGGAGAGEVKSVFAYNTAHTDIARVNPARLQKEAEVTMKLSKVNEADLSLRLLKISRNGLRLIDSAFHVLVGRSLINYQDSDGNTSLIWASVYNNSNIAQVLVEYNAMLDIQNNNGFTAFMCAAIYDSKNTAQILVDKGAQLNIIEPKTGRSALIWTALHGFFDIFRMLIDKNASLDIIDSGGDTALHWAACKGRMDMVRCLIDKIRSLPIPETERKAMLNIKNKLNQTALDCARGEEIKAFLRNELA